VARAGSAEIGIVVIGRNEGLRLERCLEGALATGAPLVYVDSGSSDGSVELARRLGAAVHPLDPAAGGFSAGRARNEGFQRLLALAPEVALVQFVDGDCELFPGWLEVGQAALRARADAAVAFGRLRERHPEASPYNRLCALEWEQPPGEVAACGGIFLARAAAFREAGGFRAGVVAGEEPELCLRLRRAGHVVLHLAGDMAWHDSAILGFGQWWRRARRAGHAYAQGAALHGRGPERHYRRECRRLWLWGLALPALALGLAWPTSGASLALLTAYPLQVVRVARAGRRRGWPSAHAWLYGGFTVLDKLPGLLGLLEFHRRRLRGRPPELIEHKAAVPR
jgi:GT2 family glycosyltransferase